MMASSVKHTAGPWVPNLSTMFIRRPDGAAIASVYGDNPDCLSDEAGRARTRLIAAAPELLKALSDLVGLVDELGGDPLGETEDSRLGLARAAIAKAEGGAA